MKSTMKNHQLEAYNLLFLRFVKRHVKSNPYDRKATRTDLCVESLEVKKDNLETAALRFVHRSAWRRSV